MRIDAHCHTDCSDGAVSIEERIAMVRACGYDAATITDHDFISTEQVRRAQAACQGLPFIPGIELSLRHMGQVVHLLGYSLRPDDADLQAYLSDVQAVDRAFTGRLLSYFRRHGAAFSLEELEGGSLHTFYSLRLVKRIARDLFAGQPSACMPAFLAAMQELGFAYPDLAPWGVRQAIDLIHAAGGIAVLAHPGGEEDAGMAALGFLKHTREQVKQYVDWGLDGIETHTPVHSAREKRAYTELAAEFHLLGTAGSDCHGDDPYLGPAWMGRFKDIPADSYERLSAFSQSRTAI